MATKDIIGLMLICLAIPAGVAICCTSEKVRDAAFFFVVAGTVVMDRMDINFVTRYWYRGTTRGFEYSLLDIVALSLLLSMLLIPGPGRKRWFWPASLGLMLVYFLYSAFSVMVSEPQIYGMFELSKILRSIIIFLVAALYVKGDKELCVLAVGVGCAVSYEALLSVKQHYLGGVYRATGSLDHPNSLSVYICTAAPLLLAAATAEIPKYVRWFCMACLPLTAITILFTVSRAGIPVYAMVLLGAAVWCVSWKFTIPRLMAAIAVCGAVLIFGIQSWERLHARFSQMSLRDEYVEEKVESRGYFLKQAKVIVDEHFMGIGLNNWSYWVSKKYGAPLGYRYQDYDDIEYAPSKEILPSFHYAAPAHNLGALTLGELGVPGLVIFIIVWLRWFQMGASFLWRRRAEAMHRFGTGIFFSISGIFLQNLVEWVYRQTQIMFLFHLLLGTLASLYYAKHHARKQAPVKQPVETELETEELAPAQLRNI